MKVVRESWQDLLLVALFAALAQIDPIPAGRSTADRALLMIAALSLMARHRAPRIVLVICLGCVLTYSAGDEAGLFAGLPVLAALYSVVAAQSAAPAHLPRQHTRRRPTEDDSRDYVRR